ncbi:MAG: hypothetical protein Q8N18_05530 [Opitutaceae bacterium]|nr:hypothetical protein [Opitutaceae bacterium]
MMTIKSIRICALLTAGLVLLPAAFAQTITTLQTLASGRPSTNLVQLADGTIYGVTDQGGANNNGTVFKLQPDGTGFQVVHSFATGAAAPAVPAHTFLLGRDGVFYGTSEFGGAASYGTLYRIGADGTGFGLVRSFTAGGPNLVLDAGAPKGGLVHADDGFLYGCATTGTATGTTIADRAGVIYRVAPDGSGYRIIFSFAGGIGSATGSGPLSLIIGRDGLLYGTAQGGPAAGGSTGGTVFRLRTDGTDFAVLKAFGNLSTPVSMQDLQSPLVHALDGYLYGTVRSGGGAGGGGAIYRLLPDGSAFQLVHSFPFSPTTAAREPTGAFFQGRDGSLYGRTNVGGTSNFGVIYKVRTDGSGYRVLANFSVARAPYVGGLIQGLDGALYATTERTIIRVVEAPGLEITEQPRSQTLAAGGSVTFSVTAPGATAYQWRRNTTNIAGATAAAYTLNNLTTAANATYTVVASNATDSVTSDGAVLLVATPNPGRLINLSVRTNAGTGAQALIAGFVIGGAGSKQVLVRGIGPTLGVFGVPGVLADPQLSLFNATSVQLATNSGWGNTIQLNNAFAAVGAFPLGATARDAALLSTLAPGNYSAQVVSAAGATGVALIEAYDSDSAASSSRFINLSARTVAGTGAQALIAGFVLSGNVPKTLLIRGIGPGLNQFGVTGTLANPRLELRTVVNNVDTLVAANAGWGGSPTLANTFVQAGAFSLPVSSADAALLVTLTPAAYSAQVSGVGGTTGIALVEVFEVP